MQLSGFIVLLILFLIIFGITGMVYLMKRLEEKAFSEYSANKKNPSPSQEMNSTDSKTTIQKFEKPNEISSKKTTMIQNAPESIDQDFPESNSSNLMDENSGIIKDKIFSTFWDYEKKHHAFQEDFDALTKIILKSPHVKIRYFPFIIRTKTKENLFFPFALPNPELEKIYTYRKMGYYNKEITPILLFYFTYQYIHYRKNYAKILELLTSSDLSSSLKNYYHYILGYERDKMDPSFKMKEIEYSNIIELNSLHENLSLLEFFNNAKNPNKAINSFNFNTLNQFTLKYFSNIPWKNYFSEIYSILHDRGTLKLVFYLKNKYGINLFSQKIIFKQIFYYGNYQKSSYLKEEKKSWILSIENIENLSKKKIYSFEHFFSKYHKIIPWLDLHIFYLFYRKNSIHNIPSNILNSLNTKYFNLEKNQFMKMTSTMPPRIRKILISYLTFSKAKRQIIWVRPLQSIFLKNDASVILSLARSLFYLKKYNKAISILKDYSLKEKNNLLILNELAIYYYYAGDIEKSEEIFLYLKNMFPENISINYNINLYTDRKYMIESFLKWKKLKEKINNIR